MMCAVLAFGVSATGLSGCTTVLDPVVSTATFLTEAEALAASPRSPGAFPTPFGVDRRPTRLDAPDRLSPEEMSRIAAEMRATGAASAAAVRRREAELAAVSPQ